MAEGLIFDIRRYSVQDGPGIRTTVFFKGCPLSCRWCHNPESQSAHPELWLRPERCTGCGACQEICPHGAAALHAGLSYNQEGRCKACGECAHECPSDARQLAGRELSVEEVMAVVERDIPFYDQSGGGVTFSGGEPLLQDRFLEKLLAACSSLDIHTAVDTSGYASWKTLRRLAGSVDLFLYDLKIMDDGRHRSLTGVSNRTILQNLERLSMEDHTIRIRVPLIPGCTDDLENLGQVGEFTRRLPNRHALELLPYHPGASVKYQRLGVPFYLEGAPTLSTDRLAEAQDLVESRGVQVIRNDGRVGR